MRNVRHPIPPGLPPVVRRVAILSVVATSLGLEPARAQIAEAPADIWAAGLPMIAPDASTFTLDNGLVVVVVPDHRAPVVTHSVYYRVGSADEQPGQTGIAHFLEHLMLKGTTNHAPGEFSAVIASLGGNENAFTTRDYTQYIQIVGRDELATMMEYEADRMANVLFPEDEVAAERAVVLEERSLRIDNEPAVMLAEEVASALHRNSPYARPVIGWRHEIEKLDSDRAYAFYNQYYTPNNAMLVVAGDITEPEVRALAEATYGQVARRAEPPPRIWPTEPPLVAARTVTIHDPRVSQPSFSMHFLAPSTVEGDGTDGLALSLAADLLGSGPNSRLFRALVTEAGIATSVSAGYGGATLGPAEFNLSGAPAPGHTLDETIAAMAAVIEDVRENGFTAEEVQVAKELVLASAIMAQDGQTALAAIFATNLLIGHPLDYVQTFPARMQAVTLEEVNAATRRYLDISTAVTARLEGVTSAPAR